MKINFKKIKWWIVAILIMAVVGVLNYFYPIASFIPGISSWGLSTKTIEESLKCPNDYASAEDYIRSVAVYFRTEMDKNPQATNEEISEKRIKDLETHNCEASKWFSAEELSAIEEEMEEIANHTITGCEAIKLDEPIDVVWAGTVESTGISTDDANIWTYVLKREPKNEEFPDEQIFNYFMTCCGSLEETEILKMGESAVLISGKWIGYVDTEDIPYLNNVSEYNNGCIPMIEMKEAYLIEKDKMDK